MSLQLKEVHGDSFKSQGKILIKVETKSAFKGTLNLSCMVENARWFPNYDVRVNKLIDPIEVSLKAVLHQNTGEDWKNVKLTFSNADPKTNSTLPYLDPYYLSFNRVMAKNQFTDRNLNIMRVYDRVSDEDGKGLPGVSVIIKGSAIGTTTDLDGNYSLELSRSATVLAFSFTGYITKDINIGNQSRIDVNMEADATELDEIVVVG